MFNATNLSIDFENTPTSQQEGFVKDYICALTFADSVNSARSYVGNQTFDDYWSKAEEFFPFILRMIDQDRVVGDEFAKYITKMNEISWEFEGYTTGGRGVAYNQAQHTNIDNRKIGTEALLKCFSDPNAQIWGPGKIILDVLGGDGTIMRFLRAQKICAPTIISADLSSLMVKACLAQKLPCIRQSATQSLFQDSVLDGVLIAYGSHHLDYASRQVACNEAFRTVKNGGRLVLHDFEIGTPAANWFDEVVAPFSRTGHPHPHFSRDEMVSLLQIAGFRNISIFYMYDPFVLKGDTAEEARTNALMHLYRMYDLVKIGHNQVDMLRQLESYVTKILGKIQIEQTGASYTATVPRWALVSTGVKAD